MYRLIPFTLWGTLLMVLLPSCRPRDNAGEVAQYYLEARLAGDFAEARSHVHPQCLDLLSDLEVLDRGNNRPEEVPISLQQLAVSGETALATFQLQGYGLEQLSLQRQGTEWKVFLSPQHVPDAGLLMGELHQLETEHFPVSLDPESLDDLLIEEENPEDWSVLTEL